MHNGLVIRLLSSVQCLAVLAAGQASLHQPSQAMAATPPPALGSVVLSPCEAPEPLLAQEGLIFVPENRAAEASRVIAVHFLRFPARQPGDLPPVFFLPGGPGGFYDERWVNSGDPRSTRYSTLAEVHEYSRTRDVIMVNQRGNSRGPGLHSRHLTWHGSWERYDLPLSIERSSRDLAEAAKAAFEFWESRGMDLAGYDIINMVDDVNDIRKAFGHEKIVLRGTSFGSQWSLAYMRRWPRHVDRALLAGVEPLDHAYDSPQGIWNVFQRLEQQVLAEGKVKLPEVGLLGALKAVVERLESKPVVVEGRHPRRDFVRTVTIGAGDFRKYLRSPIKKANRESRTSLQSWPRLVLEVYNGDYDYLASKIIDDRPDPPVRLLLDTLVENSLGITADREEKLNSTPARRWLGPVNWYKTAVRDVTPTAPVDDEFRAFKTMDIPVLMVHGDLDLSTPLENAEELLEHLPNGHLIRVNGGTHAAIHHAAQADRKFVNHLFAFMKADFGQAEPNAFFEQLPAAVDMPPLKFETTGGPSLFDEFTSQ